MFEVRLCVVVTALRVTMLLTLWLKSEGEEGEDEGMVMKRHPAPPDPLQGHTCKDLSVSHQFPTSEKLHCSLIVCILT